MLLIDMDGVLADFNGQVNLEMARNGFVPIIYDEMTDFHIEESFRRIRGDEAALRTRQLVVQSGWFRSLYPITGAIKWLNYLRSRYDVQICSAPLSHNPTCEAEKREWLEHYFDKELALNAIITKDKHTVDGAFLIDDKASIIPFLEAKDIIPIWDHIVFSHPWNRNSLGHRMRLNSWRDLPQIEAEIVKGISRYKARQQVWL